MGLEQQLDAELRQAIKERDTRTADVLRMLKTRLQERRTAKGFSGEVDDALVRDVISAYKKQLQRAVPEFEKAGERGRAQVAQLRFEVAFCERYLPKGLDETALRALVGERLAALGITDGKQVGRLVGDIMKTHKGQVEAGDIKRIADFAVKNRLPTVTNTAAYIKEGLLAGYGPNVPDQYHRAAIYIDRVLKGAQPAELPVEEPTKLDLVINGRTAKALGLALPQSILLRAVEVVE